MADFKAITIEQLGLTEDEMETFVKGSRELFGEPETEQKEGLENASVRSNSKSD